MLRYIGFGFREFGQVPMYVHRRANWEFLAVLEGRCGAKLNEAESPALVPRHLWVFPPDTAHGWAGEPAAPCKVAIFHFGRIPDILERIARRRGHIAVPLTPSQVRALDRMAAALEPHFQRRTARSHLLFERALLDLTLMALDHFPTESRETPSDFALLKTDAAVAWYGEHMGEQPTLDQVAAAVSLSVRHLRRLFHEARGASPLAAFTALRIRRAMELLSRSDAKQDAVAAACGFSSASDFCRVFKRQVKISPLAWRKQLLKGCGRPG
jgi:AraC family transcriptional regulator